MVDLTQSQAHALLATVRAGLEAALDQNLFEPTPDGAALIQAQLDYLDAEQAAGRVVRYTVPADPLNEPWDVIYPARRFASFVQKDPA